MRYTPGNKFLIFDTIQKLGGIATSKDILEKLTNDGYSLNYSSLSQYFALLKEEGFIKIKGGKGKVFKTYTIVDNGFNELDPKIYRDVVYLSFKRGFLFKEISNMLNISELLIREIYAFENSVIEDIKTKFPLDNENNTL